MKEKVLNWARQFDTFCFLDNHAYHLPPRQLECVLAAGVRRKLSAEAGSAISRLGAFVAERPSWLFGHLGYGLTAETLGLSPEKPDPSGFPDLFFFEPLYLVRLSQGEITIEAEDPDACYEALMQVGESPAGIRPAGTSIQQRLSRNEYLETIARLQQHIQRGDCYEINFCQEFFSDDYQMDPWWVYRKLMEVSPTPFAALYRVGPHWLICGSPERYLLKSGTRLLSQPIKGTAPREIADPVADAQLREQLQSSTKERAENVMVVDLVRNDLARVCEPGSVEVDELFGVYTFPKVHQLISTISGRLGAEMDLPRILSATFPMGSMTGAPKRRVVELIRAYETSGRGIFSGALGYLRPDGDFDFNVVIRSIMYNAATRYLSFQAGSGITYYSVAEKEWEECLIKAAAMYQVLR